MLVLVVEDDSDLRAALVEALENDGMAVSPSRATVRMLWTGFEAACGPPWCSSTF